MAATIKDIAKKLNISVSTVSYALNGGPRPVPELVRQRVLAVAAELDYRPNSLARSLVTRRTMTVGIVPGVLAHDLLLSPFVRVILNGILNELEEREHDGLIFTGMNLRNNHAQVSRLLDGRIDGVVFLPPTPPEDVLENLEYRRFPVVTIAAEPKHGRTNYSSDNEKGVHIAVDHLVELGHRKIGMVMGYESHRDAALRRSAFEESLAGHGLAVNPDWMVSGDFTAEGGHDAAQKILSQKDRPTALFCANDESAFGALVGVRNLGLSVPNDVSVVGYDDIFISQQASPPLTTIRQSVEEIGAAAVSGLLKKISGQEVVSQVFQPKLVQRSSTSCPPQDITHDIPQS